MCVGSNSKNANFVLIKDVKSVIAAKSHILNRISVSLHC